MSLTSISMHCPISDKPMAVAFSHVILEKYKITYYYCEDCGLIATEVPFWLDEAYQQAISDTDTGIIERNLCNRNLLEVILIVLGLEGGKFVDLAGGYGLLTRMMRDKGYNCYSIDKYCPNLFAKYFEPAKGFTADVLFAFEVLEHISNPYEFLKDMSDRFHCKTFVLSTLTYTGTIPPDDWWYYSFESGQHISFFQPKTLSRLAKKMDCTYLMINPGVHIITEKSISSLKWFVLKNKYFRKLVSCYLKATRTTGSKTWEDYLLISKSTKDFKK